MNCRWANADAFAKFLVLNRVENLITILFYLNDYFSYIISIIFIITRTYLFYEL